MLNDAESLFKIFDQLRISYETVPHQPFYSANDIAETGADQWEFPVKNIFAYDKKKQFYLIVVHLLLPAINIADLGRQIGTTGRLSFAREDDLEKFLKVKPGSVTPYAVFNDTECNVRVILDQGLQKCETISAHPLSNDQTTTISKADLMKFFDHTGHQPEWHKIPLK